MSLQLILQPSINAYYVPAHGPQGDLKWGFYDDALILSAATQASFEVTITNGATSGIIKLDGVSFEIDTIIPSTPGYTSASFRPAASALITAQRLRSAIRANQLTAGRWQFVITGDATTAILTATANDLGTQLRDSSINTTPYSLITVQADEGLLKDRLFLAYQGNFIYESGLEDQITGTIVLPPGFDYGANNDNFIPLYVDLQEAVRKYLSTPFPANQSNVPTMVHSAAGLVYLRYGSIEYAGCTLAAQDFLNTTEVAVINQAMGYNERVGPVLYTPTSLSSATKRTFSLSLRAGLNLTEKQHAWVYLYSNVRFLSTNPAQMPAYHFRFYDSSNVLISTTTPELINWPTTSAYNKSVVMIPVGPANIGALSIPAGTKYVLCEFGVSTGSVLTVMYESWKYEIMPGDCQDFEIAFLGHEGSWECLAFEEAIEEKLEISQTTVRLAQGSRTWTSDPDEAQAHGNYLFKAGETQRATSGRRRLKLRTLNLDASEGAKNLFQALLTSEDRRLILYSTKDGLTEYISAVRVNIVHASNALVVDAAGKSAYEIEIEIAEDLPTVRIS
jgi:hypothetical protein